MVKHLRVTAVAVAAAALAAFAVAVAPVGAGTTGTANALDCGVFDSLVSLTSGEAHARDG